MDRRKFIKWLGIGTLTAIVAPKALADTKVPSEGKFLKLNDTPENYWHQRFRFTNHFKERFCFGEHDVLIDEYEESWFVCVDRDRDGNETSEYFLMKVTNDADDMQKIVIDESDRWFRTNYNLREYPMTPDECYSPSLLRHALKNTDVLSKIFNVFK